MKIVEQFDFSSGGGFGHICFRLEDNRVITINYPELDVIISKKQYNSLDEYIDTDFGWEDNGDIEGRTFNIFNKLGIVY